MNKKKIGLIVVVLFLLIGLGSFVFADPNEEENLKKKGKDIEETEKIKDKDSEEDESTDEEDADSSQGVITVGDTNRTVNNNRNNNANPGGNGNSDGTGNVVVTDNGYNEALKAVEKAESSFTQDDVDRAEELVNKVTDQQGKEELQERLDAVQAAIDAEKLVAELENKVENSKNITDINDARDYRVDEEVEKVVSELKDSTLKEKLEERLEAILEILDDNDRPVITGIDNNSFTKENVILTIEDANDVTTTVTLDGKKIDFQGEFTEEGTYVVTVVDEAFNEATLTFTIDKTKPVVGGVEDGKYYNTDVAVTIDDANPGTIHLKKDGVTVKPYKPGDILTEEGTYTVYVSDKAGNKSKTITFVIDKHVEDAKWVYILNLSDKNNRKTIRNGQTLRVEVNFDEKLTKLPVLTIGNSQSTEFRKCSETDYGKYVCVADLTIDNTIANLEDGEIPFTITNIYDKADNTITLDNDNVTETKEYGQLTYDGTAPVIKSLGITDVNEFTDEVGKLYAKYGDTVRVLVRFDEKLGTEPTVKLGGKEFTATYRKDSPKYSYYSDIKLTEDMNLNDGILPFEVYGYADEIGNVGVNLTEKDVNNTTYPSVTIDNTLPVLNFHNGFITSGYTVEATDDNFAYMTVQYYDGRGTETIEGNTFTLDKEGDNTRYNIKAYDKAGNVSEYRDIYLDNANPVVSGTAINGGEEVSVENNGTYQEVTLNISDGSLKKVSLVKEDGTEEVLETYKDNFKNTKITFEKKYAEEGTYTIKAVDRNNNESTITFTIDKTPATRVYSTLDFDKSGKQYYEVDKEKVYYVKNGDSFVFRMQFSEALKTAPTVEVGGMKVPMTLNEKFLNNEGKYIYEGTVNITEEAKLSQGRLEIVLSNVVDMAGNESTDEVVLNQTPTSNGRVAIYDVTSPGPTILGITGFFNETEDAHYITYGQKVRVLTYYKEKLSVNPIVKIGNKEFETYYTEDSSDLENGVYAYYADIAITEDLGLNEGEIPFTVSGHKDLAGNEGREYTNADITYDENDKYENRFNKVILDNTKPSISGFDDNFYNNKTEIVYIDDKNLYEVKINDTKYNHDGKYFEKKLIQEGTYTVVATDKAGNTATKTVTIDKTAPKVEVTKSNNDKSTNKDVVVTITSDEEIVVEDGWKKISATTYTKEYSKDGKYSVLVKDKASNETTINFEVKRIDKVAPTAVITKSNNDKSTNKDVVVTLIANEAIYKPKGWTEVKTNKEHEFTKTYSKNGEYSVIIKDKAGNETTINFEVKRIDKAAPEITVVDSNKYYLEAGEEYVEKGYSAYDVVDKDVTNLVRISYQFQAKGSNDWKNVESLDTTKLGVYKLTYTAYDKAGNTAKGTRVVAIRDTKAPKFIGLEDKGIYNPATIQVDDATLKTISVYSKETDKTIEVENGYVIENAGSYEITAIDQESHSTTINIKVDTKMPTYTFNDGTTENNGVYGTLNLKLHDENGIASVVINGVQLPHTGYYVDINDGDAYTFQDSTNTVTVTDAAGNTVNYTFIVDKAVPTYSLNAGTTENNGVYGILNLKLHDENGIASVVINGVQLPHTGNYVDINDGDAYTFQDGINTVVVTDNLGNTEIYRFVVDKTAPTYSLNEGTIENDGKYENLRLKLHDENGIASVVINGVQLPHTGNYVDINDGDAYTFQNGKNIVAVTDNLGNTGTYEFNVIK